MSCKNGQEPNEVRQPVSQQPKSCPNTSSTKPPTVMVEISNATAHTVSSIVVCGCFCKGLDIAAFASKVLFDHCSFVFHLPNSKSMLVGLAGQT